MSPKFSNPNRRVKPVFGVGRGLSLIITILLLCVATVVIKGCVGGGYLAAPATDHRPTRH